MKVWTNNAFKGHYPVGTAAVVVANTAVEATELLNDALQLRGLGRPAIPDQFVQLPTAKAFVLVLCDGNY